MPNLFTEMTIKAGKELQDLIPKDSIDWKSQGYCLKHKCYIEIDEMGCPVCPVSWKLYCEATLPNPADSRSLDEREKEFNEKHNCEEDDWIAIPTQGQLWDMVKYKDEEEIIQIQKSNNEGIFCGDGWYLRDNKLIPFLADDYPLEIILLFYIMCSQFYKKWDGEKWVKEMS